MQNKRFIISKLQRSKCASPCFFLPPLPLPMDNETIEKQDENLIKKDQTHDRFPFARIIPDHLSNVSLLDCRRATESAAFPLGEERRGRDQSELSVAQTRAWFIYLPRENTSRNVKRGAVPRVSAWQTTARISARPEFSDCRPPTATDSNPPNLKTDLRTDICAWYARRFRLPARLFAVAHSDEPQTARNFQSKRSYKRRSRHCGCMYRYFAFNAEIQNSSSITALQLPY